VVRLILEGGRCRGVETEDGERYVAREAVLSSIHVRPLLDMAPASEWGEDFRYGVETFDPGLSLFAAYYATTEPPRYPAPGGDGTVTAVSTGVVGTPEQVMRIGHDACLGRVALDAPWLLVATPTVADPSRAPEGGHTVKVLGMQPYDPGGGPERWEQLRAEIARAHLGHLRRAAPNLVDKAILAELVVTPPDLERSNPHMWRGTFHGGDRSLAHSGALRPAPGWAQHRMPIAGLYQTGGSTHPGGSVTGGPGRNAAIVMLTDLGDDPREVMEDARRARAGRH
jgi:phytoene dehydrogenase-like protein